MSEKLEITKEGDYKIGDRVVSASEVGKLYEKNKKSDTEDLELQEGECSGPISLND